MKELNSYIEHTILGSSTTKEDVLKICSEAKKYNFKGVCVPPYFVDDVSNELNGTGIKVVTVIGFPMGYTFTSTKVEEIKKAIDSGADELDVVLNVSAVKSGDWRYIDNELDRLTTICSLRNRKLKLILETSLLTRDEMAQATEIAVRQGVDFIKTSTGFFGGAEVEVVKFLKGLIPDNVGLKASGGIRDKETAIKMIEAGANRIGASAGIKIVS